MLTTSKEKKVSPLIKAAKFSVRKQRMENYFIAAVGGLILGVMLGLGV